MLPPFVEVVLREASLMDLIEQLHGCMVSCENSQYEGIEDTMHPLLRAEAGGTG